VFVNSKGQVIIMSTPSSAADCLCLFYLSQCSVKI